jgi:hypothetical protein
VSVQDAGFAVTAMFHRVFKKVVHFLICMKNKQISQILTEPKEKKKLGHR